MFQLQAQSKELQLIFERSPDVPQYVQTDEIKLRQVLINLLEMRLNLHRKVALMSESKVRENPERSPLK